MTNPTQFLSRTGYRLVTASGLIGSLSSGTGLTGGPFDGSANVTISLANTTVTAGSYGSPSQVATYTVDAQGRLTASANATIAITASQVTDFSEATDDRVAALIQNGTGLTWTYNDAGNTLTGNVSGFASSTLTNTHIFVGNAGNVATDVAASGDLTLANTGAFTFNTVNANVGTFGSATQVASPTVNEKGLTTAISNITIAIPSTQITDFNEAAEDAVGGILTDTATIDFTYNDAGNQITADLKNTTVVAGAYKYTNLTVDAQGRLTAAATGINTFTSADQTITSAGALTLAHSLGAIPDSVEAFLVNQTAQLGYSVGDIVCINLQGAAIGVNKGLSIVLTATNLVIRIGSAVSSFDIIRKDTGAGAAITNVNWKLRFKARVFL